MPVEEAGKLPAALLPLSCDGQEISVLSEQHAVQLRRPLKKERIFDLGGSVLVGGQDIHSPETLAFGDRHRNVMIHVKAERHTRPRALSFTRIGDSPAAVFDCSTK